MKPKLVPTSGDTRHRSLSTPAAQWLKPRLVRRHLLPLGLWQQPALKGHLSNVQSVTLRPEQGWKIGLPGDYFLKTVRHLENSPRLLPSQLLEEAWGELLLVLFFLYSFKLTNASRLRGSGGGGSHQTFRATLMLNCRVPTGPHPPAVGQEAMGGDAGRETSSPGRCHPSRQKQMAEPPLTSACCATRATLSCTLGGSTAYSEELINRKQEQRAQSNWTEALRLK